MVAAFPRWRAAAGLVATLCMTACVSAVRLPWNRPDIQPFYDTIAQPVSSDGAVDVVFLGASSLLFDDGTTRLLSDGFFSRPEAARVMFTRIAPRRDRINAVLARLGADTIDVVFVVHSHYDHAFDAPLVADRTGAELVGSASTRNVAIGLGSHSRFRRVEHADSLRYGDFSLVFLESIHSAPDRAKGAIETPLIPPRHALAWKTGETFSVLIGHPTGRILLHPSAHYIPGAFDQIRTDVVYLGVIGLGEVSPEFIEQYWNQVVGATCARRVVLIHWDDIMRPLSEELVALPYGGGGATDAMPQLIGLARRDSVDIWLPRSFEATNPLDRLPPRRSGCAPPS